jgi:low molecular weight protein-tyrosine phosphatase
VTDGTDQPYAILCVCTGNVCRSPAAELLLAARLGPSVAVTSAGTLGLVGRPIEPPMAAQLAALGLAADGFAARRLTAADVRGADLVLGLTRGHRAEAVELAPAAVRRSFTLLEFARLLRQISPEELPHTPVADRLRRAVPLAAARRQMVVGPVNADDVVDPYRLAQEVYEQSFAAIRIAVDTIADRLVPYPGYART